MNELKFHPYSNLEEILSDVITEIYGNDKYVLTFSLDQEYWDMQRGKDSSGSRGHRGMSEYRYNLVVTEKETNNIVVKYWLYCNGYFHCCGVYNFGDYHSTNSGNKYGILLPLLVAIVMPGGLLTMTMNTGQKAAMKICDKLVVLLGGSYAEFKNTNSGNTVRHYQIYTTATDALNLRDVTVITEKSFKEHGEITQKYMIDSGRYQKYYDSVIKFKDNCKDFFQPIKLANTK